MRKNYLEQKIKHRTYSFLGVAALAGLLCFTGCGSAAKASLVKDQEESQAEVESVSGQDLAAETGEAANLQTAETEIAGAEVPAEAPAEVQPPMDPVSLNFVAVGDNLINGNVLNCGLGMGGDFNYLYQYVVPYIQQADVAVVNQETVFVDDPDCYSGYPTFGTPTMVGDALVNAGFDIFTCATNHALDQDMYGVDSAISYYDSRGLFYVGIQPSSVVDRVPYKIYEQNGIRCAILNYTYGTNGYPLPDGYPNMVHMLNPEDEGIIRAEIAAAEADADVTLVFVHWGDEYATYMSDSQAFWRQVFFESGVDVVVGAHPHILQPYELMSDGQGRDMLIYYSLGNFCSGQDQPERTVGGLANFTITKTSEGTFLTDYGLDALVTHQSWDFYSQVFKLSDYNDDFAASNWMDVNCERLWNIFDAYTVWD